MEQGLGSNLDHPQSEFSAPCEAQVIHFIDNVSQDMDRGEMLNDQRKNRQSESR